MSTTQSTKSKSQSGDRKSQNPGQRRFIQKRGRNPIHDPKSPSQQKSVICRAVAVLLSKSTGMPYSSSVNGDAGVSAEDMVVGVGIHGIRPKGNKPFSRLGIYAMSADGHLHFVRSVEFKISSGDPDFKTDRPGTGSDLDRTIANWVSGALHNPEMAAGDYFPKFDYINDGGFIGDTANNQAFNELVTARSLNPRDFALDRRLDARIDMVREFMEKSEHARIDQGRFNGLQRIPIFVEGQLSENLLTMPEALTTITMAVDAFRECAFNRFRQALPTFKDSSETGENLRKRQREVRFAFQKMAEQVVEMWTASFDSRMFTTNFDGLSTNLMDRVKGYLALYCKAKKIPVEQFDAMIYARHAIMAVHALKALFNNQTESGITVWSLTEEAMKNPDEAIRAEAEDLISRPMFSMAVPAGSGSIQVRSRFMSNGDFPFEGTDLFGSL